MIYGIISLTDSVFESLNFMIRSSSKNSKSALKLIKKTKYSLPYVHSSKYQKWLKQIPCDMLDPYY